MAYPSSWELLKKAEKKNQNADRWAALQSSASKRVEIRESKAAETEEEKPRATPEPEEKSREPYVPGHPNLREPPFPPPQPRHTALDAIQQRHLQAIQSAMPAQEWKKQEKTRGGGERRTEE